MLGDCSQPTYSGRADLERLGIRDGPSPSGEHTNKRRCQALRQPVHLGLQRWSLAGGHRTRESVFSQGLVLRTATGRMRFCASHSVLE